MTVMLLMYDIYLIEKVIGTGRIKLDILFS